MSNTVFSNAEDEWITYNADNATSTASFLFRKGDMLYFNLRFTTLAALDDSSVELATINLEKIGLNSLNYTSYLPACGDGPNGVLMCSLGSAGTLTAIDSVAADGADTVSAGNFFLCFTMTVMESAKLDSACDNFIWRRIA